MRKLLSFVSLLVTVHGYSQLPTATIGLGDYVMKTSTSNQSEVSISICKTFPQNLIASFNSQVPGSFNHQTGTVHSHGLYYSNDGGVTWSGNDYMPNSVSTWGDPSTAFDAFGIGYLTGLDANLDGFSQQRTTWGPIGENWSTASTVSTTHANDYDKEMSMAIDEMSSIYAGNYYCAWRDDNSSTGGVIKTEWSHGQGPPFWNETQVSQNFSSGANVQVGPDGEVYICWADYTNGSLPGQNIGFAFSSDGGATYPTPSSSSLIFPYSAPGRLGSAGDPNFGNTRVNGFPSMAVDKSCGANHGRIYIVYPELVSGASVINMRFSDNQGTTWHPDPSPPPLLLLVIRALLKVGFLGFL